MEPIDLLIITPLFHGDGSGASVYYQILTKQLVRSGLNVAVLSERSEGDFPINYLGLLAKRSGRAKRGLSPYFAYAIQNLQYMKLYGVFRRLAPRAVLAHSSFYNFPGLWPMVVSYLKRLYPGTRFICDVRDRLLPESAARHINRFDAVIACSLNVKRHLCSIGVVKNLITRIPVIQESLSVSNEQTKEVLEKFSLEGEKYILYAGNVTERKSVDRLLESFHAVVAPAAPNVSLVIAGMLKTGNKSLLRDLGRDRVYFLGKISRYEITALMGGAQVCINPSPNEGFPRSSLEALVLARSVILPPNVPEFAACCPDNVLDDVLPETIGRSLLSHLETPKNCNYPIDIHLPDNVIPLYETILGIA